MACFHYGAVVTYLFTKLRNRWGNLSPLMKFWLIKKGDEYNDSFPVRSAPAELLTLNCEIVEAMLDNGTKTGRKEAVETPGYEKS